MAKVVPVEYPAVPSKIGEINNAFIKTYIAEEFKKGNLSVKQVKELQAAQKKAKEDSGSRYFIAYRKEFCRICFPQLYKPTKNSGINWDDFFSNLLKDAE